MPPTSPSFVLVKSTNPHNDGRYGRLGLRFTREWRALRVDPSVEQAPRSFITVRGIDDKGQPATKQEPDPSSLRDPQASLDDGVISPATLAALEADDHLAVKPATAAEIAAAEAERAESGGDKDAQIDALRAKNSDLESRLMKLELAASGGGKAKPDPKGDSPKG